MKNLWEMIIGRIFFKVETNLVKTGVANIFQVNWKPISTHMTNEKELVFIRSKHYDRIKLVKSKKVKYCHAAEHWSGETGFYTYNLN